MLQVKIIVWRGVQLGKQDEKVNKQVKQDTKESNEGLGPKDGEDPA